MPQNQVLRTSDQRGKIVENEAGYTPFYTCSGPLSPFWIILPPTVCTTRPHPNDYTQSNGMPIVKQGVS